MHKFNKIYNYIALKLEKVSHFGQLFEPGGQKSCPFWKTFRICKTKKSSISEDFQTRWLRQ